MGIEIEIPSLDDTIFIKACKYCSTYRNVDKGTGQVFDYTVVRPKKVRQWEPPLIICKDCQGTGLVLSDVGQRLLTFLREAGLTVKHPLERS